MHRQCRRMRRLGIACARGLNYTLEQGHVANLHLVDEAIRAERLPNLSVFADFGGVAVVPGIPTSNVSSPLPHIVRIRNQDSDLRRPRGDTARRGDRSIAGTEIKIKALRRQIELEIRLSFEGLAWGTQQVQLSEGGNRAGGRGIGPNSGRYERALPVVWNWWKPRRDWRRPGTTRITALYQHNVARPGSGRGHGTVAEMNWLRSPTQKGLDAFCCGAGGSGRDRGGWVYKAGAISGSLGSRSVK